MGHQTIDALRGAGPDVAVAILEHRAYRVARQARQHRRALDRRMIGHRSLAYAPQALADRRDPQVAAAIVNQPVAASGLDRSGSRAAIANRPEADDRVVRPHRAAGVLAEAQAAQRIGRRLELCEAVLVAFASAEEAD